jgi:hypothetical protein
MVTDSFATPGDIFFGASVTKAASQTKASEHIGGTVMQAFRTRTMIVTASLIGFGLLSACSKQPAPSANAADAMSITDNGGSMADGAAMTPSNSMAADGNSMAANSMSDSMSTSDSMQKNSH